MTNIEILTLQAIQSIDCKMRDQHEIDWEQRRYEIAKECLPTVYQTALEIAKKTGVIEKPKDIVAVAVDLADLLIENLKKDKE
ncbi:hypothetical protein CTM59_09690 [Prevotella intermedia]|uniref:Uncharacterized protein n=1 Tax=Prevotella intermedia TaxID=28131 RepID=A0A2M8TKA0_PREIN|nr:hypothetical protein [Prevotella intermedia]PJI24383.1 hypothetical protein CTM59_09690 [Prevotella intermedia]